MIYVKGGVPGNAGEWGEGERKGGMEERKYIFFYFNLLLHIQLIYILFLHKYKCIVGVFVRIVDAVKGPKYPTPAPFPSFLMSLEDPNYPKGLFVKK